MLPMGLGLKHCMDPSQHMFKPLGLVDVGNEIGGNCTVGIVMGSSSYMATVGCPNGLRKNRDGPSAYQGRLQAFSFLVAPQPHATQKMTPKLLLKTLSPSDNRKLFTGTKSWTSLPRRAVAISCDLQIIIAMVIPMELSCTSLSFLVTRIITTPTCYPHTGELCSVRSQSAVGLLCMKLLACTRGGERFHPKGDPDSQLTSNGTLIVYCFFGYGSVEW
nr:hypothetical protein Iba_chr10eCG14860 [Ipomoea batatas]